MELFILFGGFYALYVVGNAIATTLDYQAVNKTRKYKKWLSIHFYILLSDQFFYLSLSDSLLKSQRIHCKNGSQLACSYLLEASQKQNKDI